MRKSRLRIHGTDRGLMMLARDVRRRWLQYGDNRKLEKGLCADCKKELWTEVDHKIAVGARPRTPEEFGPYIRKMFYTPCQGLGKECHAKKTKEDRTNIRKTV